MTQGRLVRPEVCKLLYTNLQSLPNIKRLFMNPTKLRTEAVFCDKPVLSVCSRCIRYGTAEYADFSYSDQPWINTDKDIVFGKHINLEGKNGTLYLNTLDICYALLNIYLQGYIKEEDRSKVINLVERVLNGTKPSCKNYVNNYYGYLAGIDLSLLNIEDMIDILYDDVIFHHCEFVEVRIDVQTILSEVNRLILVSNQEQ